jgi:hypothetical protein
VSTPIWLEAIKVVATVGVTLVAAWWARQIGIGQREIARRQANTAHAQRIVSEAKLNLDLFEHRYAIFEKVWAFLSKPVVNSDELEIWPREFNRVIPRAHFLFGKNIADYMSLASEKHVELATILEAIKQRAGSVATEDESKRIEELQTWFYTEATDCFKKFAEYLNFSTWKADPNPDSLHVLSRS